MALHNPQTTNRTERVLGLPEFVALMAVMTSLVALSIDAMLPALDHIGAQLGSASVQENHLIVSLFFLGMAVGQLYYGPVSDARGRRSAILSGLVVFSIGTVICLLAESMTMLLVGRVVQAFGVSGPRIASLAVIRDQYAGDAMARVMSFIMMVFILVPMLAPAFGQWILSMFDWRHIFTSFLIIGFIAGAWFFIRQPETLPREKRTPFSVTQLKSSIWFILKHRVVMGYTLAMGAIFGAFLAYLSASQTVFESIYLVGDLFPLYFACLAFSIGFASFVNGKLVMRMGMVKLSHIALVGMVASALVLVLCGLIWNGVPPLNVFVGVMFIMFFFIGILFGNLNSMAMLPLGHVAGLGAAVIGSLSSLISVPVAIFIGQFIETDIMPVAVGFLLFGIVATVFIRWAGSPYQNIGVQDSPEHVAPE